MDQILKLFGNSDQLLIAVSIALVMLASITPKKFLGFEVDWTVPKSTFVFLVGLALLGFAVWHIYTNANAPADNSALPLGWSPIPKSRGPSGGSQ